MLVRLLCGLLLVLAISSVGICKLKYEVVWRVDGKGGFSAPNYLVDVMTGKPIGIIVCEGDVGVTRFDLRGRKVWEYP